MSSFGIFSPLSACQHIFRFHYFVFSFYVVFSNIGLFVLMPMQFYGNNLLYVIVSTKQELKKFYFSFSQESVSEGGAVSDSFCCAVNLFWLFGAHISFSQLFFGKYFCLLIFRKDTLSQYQGCRDIPELSHGVTLTFKMNRGGPLNCYYRKKKYCTIIREEAGIGKNEAKSFTISI